MHDISPTVMLLLGMSTMHDALRAVSSKVVQHGSLVVWGWLTMANRTPMCLPGPLQGAPHDELFLFLQVIYTQC
jgi:hypothetical protein